MSHGLLDAWYSEQADWMAWSVIYDSQIPIYRVGDRVYKPEIPFMNDQDYIHGVITNCYGEIDPVNNIWSQSHAYALLYDVRWDGWRVDQCGFFQGELIRESPDFLAWLAERGGDDRVHRNADA